MDRKRLAKLIAPDDSSKRARLHASENREVEREGNTDTQTWDVSVG